VAVVGNVLPRSDCTAFVLHLALWVRPLVPSRVHDTLPCLKCLHQFFEVRLWAVRVVSAVMARKASSSPCCSVSRAPRVRSGTSDRDITVPSGAWTCRRGGIPTWPDIIALGRSGLPVSAGGGGSVAAVPRSPATDADHMHLVASDRAVASDKSKTGTASRHGPGGPSSTPFDSVRPSGAFVRPLRPEYSPHLSAATVAANHGWAADVPEISETNEAATTAAEGTREAAAAARAVLRHGSSETTNDSAAQMSNSSGLPRRTMRGSRRIVAP